MRSKAPWLLALPAVFIVLYVVSLSTDPSPQLPTDIDPATLNAKATMLNSDPKPPASTPSGQLASRTSIGSVTAQVPDGSEPLSGTLCFTDASGRKLPDVNMDMMLTLEHPDRNPEQIWTSVRAGRWSTKIDPLAGFQAVRFNGLTLLDQYCPPVQPSETLPLPIVGPVDLVYRFPGPVNLRVCDSDTGSDIEEVWLTEHLAFGLAIQDLQDSWIPSPEIHSGLKSPIDLTQLDWPGPKSPWLGEDLDLFVGGPKHAWVKTSVPLLSGYTHQVNLDPAAGLIVELEGLLTPGLDLHLRLYRDADSQILCSLPLKNIGRQRFRGLAPGRLEVRIEIGDLFPAPERVVAEQVLLVPGETATLKLLLPEQAAIAYGNVAGIVLWPPGWEVDGQASLVAKRIDSSRVPGRMNAPIQLQLQPAASTTPGWTEAAFEFLELESGRYELMVHPSGDTFLAEVTARSAASLELRISEPIELTLRFVDAVTGMAVRPRTVLWCPTRPKEVWTGNAVPYSTAHFSFDVELMAHRQLVPQGTIELECWTDDYMDFYIRELEIGPAKPSEVRIELQRAAELRVSFTSNSERLPIGRAIEMWVLRADTRERVATFFDGDNRQGLFVVPANGTYIVEPPELPGFVAPPAREIHVSSDEPAELVYEYQRVP
jgi:hypothetical protein